MARSSIKRTTITLPQHLTKTLVHLTKTSSQTKAVVFAITEEIKRRKLGKIRALAGKLDLNAVKGRHHDHRLR